MIPRLLALKSAVPPHALDQSDVFVHAAHLFQGRKDIMRLLRVFASTGIERRYSCVPLGWYSEQHGWAERTSLYVNHAVALLEKITLALLDEAMLKPEDIDAIVVSSTTGIATPSLDALVVERLGLRRDIRRLPIFGLGCAGGVGGLTRAAEMAKAHPGSRVLFLTVELCALTFRKDDLSKSNIVATALFGDGAAGAIVSTHGDGPALGPGGEHTFPGSLDIMGWDVEEDGLKARFAQSIPALVASDFKTILQTFLQKNDLEVKDIDGFACHPGGAKVLDALEDSFGLAHGALTESRSVLRDYGNMSAVTALFVLESMNWRDRARRTLMTALGLGFSAVFLMVGGA
jgi:alkylresorcinol/alkylpyrone synthase